MAGKRKEESLTIEDNLKAAIVPEAEQSYPIPENWVWTRLGEISLAPQYGWTTSAASEGDVKLLRTTDITSGQIDWSSVPYCKEIPSNLDKYLIQDGDIVISRAGSVGFSHLIRNPEKAVFASYLIRFRPLIERNYLAYFLKSRTYWDAISESSSGIAIPNVNASKLKKISIPVAPLPEQQRIAEKLESLLEKIKEAKALLDEVPDILQNFRQTVLSAACSGRLTEDWRKGNPNIETAAELLKRIESENTIHQIQNPPYISQDMANNATVGQLPASWATVELGKTCELVPNRNPEKENDVLFKYIDITSISNSSHTVIALNEILGSEAPSRARRSIRKNDILFSTVRTYLKNIAMVTQDEENMLCSTGFCVIRSSTGIQPNYVFYSVLNDEFINRVTLTQTGTSYPATSDKKIFSELIALPPFPEQTEIVSRVESLFSKADDLEAQYKEAMDNIEILPEIILSKAFRGELVPQDPNDEPASVLLKRIIESCDKEEPVEIFIEEVVVAKEKVTVKKRIPLFDVLKEANDWLSASDLLHKAGYPRDADPDTIEDFYQQLKQELKTTPPRIERERRKENDYFRAL